MAKVILNKGDINRTIGVGNTALVKGDVARVIAIAPAVVTAAPPAILPGIDNIDSVVIANMSLINGIALSTISNINGIS